MYPLSFYSSQQPQQPLNEQIISIELMAKGEAGASSLYPSPLEDPELISSEAMAAQYIYPNLDAAAAAASESQAVTDEEQKDFVQRTKPRVGVTFAETVKRVIVFILLAVLSWAITIFYYVHTTLVSSSERMSVQRCPPRYGSPSFFCYSLLQGFGYSSATISLLIGLICMIQALATMGKNTKVLIFFSRAGTVLSALASLFFLSGLVVFAIWAYDFGADTLIAYICSFLIHLLILAANCYTLFKAGSVFATSSIRASVVIAFLFNLAIVINGLILIGVFQVWLKAVTPVIMLLASGVVGFLGHAMAAIKQPLLPKLGVLLLKTSSTLNLLTIGASVCLMLPSFTDPVVFAIVIPIGLMEMVNAGLAKRALRLQKPSQ